MDSAKVLEEPKIGAPSDFLQEKFKLTDLEAKGQAEPNV